MYDCLKARSRLSCILDLSSRTHIGESLSCRIDVQLPRGDLEMTLAHLQISSGLIRHSDQGKQYCRYGYMERLLDVATYKSHVDPRTAY